AAPLPSPISIPTAMPTPFPTATPVDGVRQPTVGPYIPPALRTDNFERRGAGIQGRRALPAPVKVGTPMANLPDLNESRKTRQSPVTPQTLGVSQFRNEDHRVTLRINKSLQRHHRKDGRAVTSGSASAFQHGPGGCADCDPSGG